MSHLGNVFANTYDKEVFLDKEDKKTQTLEDVIKYLTVIGDILVKIGCYKQ